MSNASIDTIVIGASAGGVEALTRLVSALPRDLAACVCVVMHFPETSMSILPDILMRKGQLPASHALDGERTENGRIYVAPPGSHMLLSSTGIRLMKGARENGSRPAIDPLFRTAARSRRARVLSVVLSGLLDDGTLGTSAVSQEGGVTFAQDPEEALFGDMPRNAIEQVGVDHVLPLYALPTKLLEYVGRPVEAYEWPVLDPTEMTMFELQKLESLGKPSTYVCPECHGTLFELQEEGVLHYRCRVGHSYLAESLAKDQASVLETALWTALRAIKEHNAFLVDMLKRSEQKGFTHSARSYRTKLEEGDRRLLLIETALSIRRVAEERPEEENSQLSSSPNSEVQERFYEQS